MIKVNIVDDHSLFLESLALLISNIEGVELVYKTDNAEDMLRNMPFYPCDILISDYQMPGMSGLELTKQLMLKQPEVKVLMLTMVENIEIIKAAFKAGASGYILKNAKKVDFEKAIKNLAMGEKYYFASVFQKLQQHAYLLEEALSERELEVVKLIAEEYSSSQIAEKLFISLNTVETHRKNIFRKTGVKNSFGLLKYALLNQLIEL
ncbi:DNA-binding response regulator [Lacihabitans sp. LS3-19]|uniref:response regulator transcription factor n=1 Tax=Lacihabitans sp. LS3-19 TaxID=2487335 RepID=UPI0020CF4920|nr:response regulator transcription factor [Lacihabitans sp. LS3-19]MCP9767235.1 DNA-binding response regulator [Lacihabitans sp. LS3-19]